MSDAVQPGCEAGRIVEFAEVLVGLQEHVLRQVQSVFPVGRDSQQIVVNAFFPSGDEEVVGLHATSGCLANQVGIFDRPKDQILWLLVTRRSAPVKSRPAVSSQFTAPGHLPRATIRSSASNRLALANPLCRQPGGRSFLPAAGIVNASISPPDRSLTRHLDLRHRLWRAHQAIGPGYQKRSLPWS